MLLVLVAQTCHLACLLRPLWLLGDHRAIQGHREHRKEHLGFQALIAVDLGGFRDRILKGFGKVGTILFLVHGIPRSRFI